MSNEKQRPTMEQMLDASNPHAKVGAPHECCNCHGPTTVSMPCYECWVRMLARFAELERERDAYRADAERYRWLRGNGAIIDRHAKIPVQYASFGIGLDAAIERVEREMREHAADWRHEWKQASEWANALTGEPRG